jgi:hypothetical protein
LQYLGNLRWLAWFLLMRRQGRPDGELGVVLFQRERPESRAVGVQYIDERPVQYLVGPTWIAFG